MNPYAEIPLVFRESLWTGTGLTLPALFSPAVLSAQGWPRDRNPSKHEPSNRIDMDFSVLKEIMAFTLYCLMVQ